MHASGKRMCVEATYPSGRREMLNCAGYNHNWVKVYAYEDDVAPLLPAGTILHVIGSLRPEYLIDDEIMMLNIADIRGGQAGNQRPVVTVEGATHRAVKVGEPLPMTAVASDDGRPKPRPAPPRRVRSVPPWVSGWRGSSTGDQATR